MRPDLTIVPHTAQMALLGKAAMLLSFDVVEEAIPEHDEWHTHEHLPEGSPFRASSGEPAGSRSAEGPGTS